jgi:voltage-gated potassium channel
MRSGRQRDRATRAAGLRRKLAGLHRRSYRRLRLDLWFPQVPLAFAVGGAGLFALLPALRTYAAEYLHLNLSELLSALHPVSGKIPRLILAGVPMTAVGILQILIAFGLLARSRIAWLSAVVMSAAELALMVHAAPGALVNGQTAYVAVLLVALIAARNQFDRSSLAAGTLFSIAAVLILLVYGMLGALLLGGDFAPPITNLTSAFYFTIVTMSTVGYGDIVPKTGEARIFVVSLIVLGLTVFATALTAVIGPVVQDRINRTLGYRRAKVKRVNHYIVTGQGALARNTVRELRERGQPVLVVAEQETAGFGDAEVMIGDPTELAVLSEAGAQHARAILALSDDDSENAFVILAAHELETEAKKVAAVSSRKNLERVRRVHPDMVFAAPVFGSEALVMALTEQQIDRDWLLSRLLDEKPSGAT